MAARYSQKGVIMSKFAVVRVIGAHLIAYSILAFIIALPLRCTGFLSGYIGWAIVLPLLYSEMDDETRGALMKWMTRKP